MSKLNIVTKILVLFLALTAVVTVISLISDTDEKDLHIYSRRNQILPNLTFENLPSQAVSGRGVAQKNCITGKDGKEVCTGDAGYSNTRPLSGPLLERVLQSARNKLSWKYSQPKRLLEGYVDCSSLCGRCFMEAGALDFPGGNSANTWSIWGAASRGKIMTFIDCKDVQAGDMMGNEAGHVVLATAPWGKGFLHASGWYDRTNGVMHNVEEVHNKLPHGFYEKGYRCMRYIGAYKDK